MDQGKSSSHVGLWLVVACAAALWFAVKGNRPDAVAVDTRPTVAPTAEPAPKQPAVPTFAESIPRIPPASRLGLAQSLASFGLQRPAERREAYATAAALLTSFPVSDTAAPQARALLTEVVARQQLPAADRRPVSDAEMFAYVQRLLREPAPAPAPRPARRPSSGTPAPSKVAAAEAPRAPSLQEIRDGFGVPPARTFDAIPEPAPRRAFMADLPARPALPPPAAYDYVPTSPGGPVHVRGYTKADGTYVAPHTRSAPRR